MRSEEFRSIMARWASGVAIVGACDIEGYRGITVTSFTVASINPPLVLVCLDKLSNTLAAVTQSKKFSVSFLNRDQEFLAERFADQAPPVDAQWREVPHSVTPSGLPVLSESLAWLECKLIQLHSAGDHDLALGSVLSVGCQTGEPLLRWERRYWNLA